MSGVSLICRLLFTISVDAIWGAWGAWSGCDKPCNNGSFVRNRYCFKALYGGRVGCGENGSLYVKADEENRPCNDFKCSGIRLQIYWSIFQIGFIYGLAWDVICFRCLHCH